ncbi:hypothetical protein LIER_16379 [Lithospermum erythrorhizon]|uniref:Protein kinase domain-containing protein n=1 Tax=Lithospermum erythrorhizon TaxID=34254 RepID=A0AAV3Q8C7_LITER
MAEVNIQGTLSHPNIVKLLGYFHHDRELILVYEYTSKRLLNNHLFCSKIRPLPGDIRVKILTGAARALTFLHSSDTNIIFRDVSTSSILLDEVLLSAVYNTKLSGLGLARLGPSVDESHVKTHVVGTFGYIDPEYFKTGQCNSKCDVYGFGVVMVEMLTGLRALDSRRPNGQENMIHWIKPHLYVIENLEVVMDSQLNGRYPLEEASNVAQTALTCLEDEPKMRPSMKEVLETLEGITSLSLSTSSVISPR